MYGEKCYTSSTTLSSLFSALYVIHIAPKWLLPLRTYCSLQQMQVLPCVGILVPMVEEELEGGQHPTVELPLLSAYGTPGIPGSFSVCQRQQRLTQQPSFSFSFDSSKNNNLLDQYSYQ